VIDLTRLGVGLLIAGAAAIVVECLLAALWTARLSRKSRLLTKRIAEDQRLLESDVAKLREAMAETVRLWQPYRRLLRYLRHPLVIALLQSYLRRGMAAR
jgi:hypothetical protein